MEIFFITGSDMVEAACMYVLEVPDGLEVYCSPTCHCVAGVSREEGNGETLHGLDKEITAANLTQLLAGEQV